MTEPVENQMTFPALQVARKNGDETFSLSGNPLEFRLSAFWQWSASDLVSNATRGVLAEFLVASALGLAGGVRAEWDAFDILLADGTRVEVKSAAYLQSWAHAKLSNVTFSIRPACLEFPNKPTFFGAAPASRHLRFLFVDPSGKDYARPDEARTVGILFSAIRGFGRAFPDAENNRLEQFVKIKTDFCKF